MDGFNEKKWFIYLTDHHEGPFSLAEIQTKIAQSQIAPSNYVWAEGMADWKPMTEVTEFGAILAPPPPSSPLTPAAEVAPAVPAEPIFTVTPTLEPSLIPFQEEPAIEKTRTLEVSELPQAKDSQASQPFNWVKFGVFVSLLAGITALFFAGTFDSFLRSPSIRAVGQTFSQFTQPQLLSLVERYPSLSQWISPLPMLEDVTTEDYQNLRNVASAQLETAGPKLAVALSTADILAPSFYLATNLPDGTLIDVWVEGIPDTLLNQPSLSTKVQATITKKLGKTAAVRAADGKPLPRGEYIIYITEAAQQPPSTQAVLSKLPPVIAKVPANLPKGLKILVSKAVFLGGSKDGIYLSRLKEYHDKLHAKATTELTEIKQFATTLEGQLANDVEKFAQWRAGSKNGRISPAARKGWGGFTHQWIELQTQLKASYEKWTPQILQTEYFYGELYDLTRQAALAVEAVHALHDTFFSGKADLRALDIQLGTTVSGAQTALSVLKNKLETNEKLAPTPNGMPRKEETIQ
ncbi:DUF4339 domain-containing protein [Bdellovibrionota bacterium FG-1]